MTGGQEKNFSTLGPKLRENRAQQYYGDKQRQIRVENIDYIVHIAIRFLSSILFNNSQLTLDIGFT